MNRFRRPAGIFLLLIACLAVEACTSATRYVVISKASLPGQADRAEDFQQVRSRDEILLSDDLTIRARSNSELFSAYGVAVAELIKVRQPIQPELSTRSLKVLVEIGTDAEERLIHTNGRIHGAGGMQLEPVRKLLINGPCVMGAETEFPAAEISVPLRLLPGKTRCLIFLYDSPIDPRLRYEFQLGALTPKANSSSAAKNDWALQFAPKLFALTSRQ